MQGLWLKKFSPNTILMGIVAYPTGAGERQLGRNFVAFVLLASNTATPGAVISAPGACRERFCREISAAGEESTRTEFAML